MQKVFIIFVFFVSFSDDGIRVTKGQTLSQRVVQFAAVAFSATYKLTHTRETFLAQLVPTFFGGIANEELSYYGHRT